MSRPQHSKTKQAVSVYAGDEVLKSRKDRYNTPAEGTITVQKFPASPQQGDLRLSGPPSGQGAGSGARTRDRRLPADLRADSQATLLPTPR
ncbi:hypothetical protein PoB_001363200 [Plakobranchus ocellatus]|uniref:Uncharacterized protein n=1 Tax=Plakobranchus ocellatus TaxID=259542 RepID=A0AAV3YY50_9GAST|nr:hypothetical protein PoB_001363200 [Plakobranchus ocellatus]